MRHFLALAALLLFLPTASLAASKTAAKSAPRPRYKGLGYTAVVASPLGLYSKTRLYALVDGALREVRLSKSVAAAFPSGMRIAFIAQEKEDGDASFLLTNPKSIRTLDASATATFTSVEAWPEQAGAFRFQAEMVSRNKAVLAVRLGGVEGEVLAPAGLTASLKPGDIVAVEGYVSPGTRPRAVLPRPEALTLYKAAKAAAQAAAPAPKLPWQAVVVLTLLTALIGGFAYLRHQRLQRLALMSAGIDKDEEIW